jgi:hypothetical protein
MTNKLFEGGSMPGVGPIHIDEIKPTLATMEKHRNRSTKQCTWFSR